MTQDIMPDNSLNESQNYNGSFFRGVAAVQTPEPTASVRIDTKTETTESSYIEPTFTEFLEVKGIPFVAEYLGLDKQYKDLAPRDIKSISKVEEYISKKISNGSYIDTLESASELIKDIETKIKLSDNHSPFLKLEKISDFLSVVKEGTTPITKKKPKKQIIDESAKTIKALKNNIELEKIEKGALAQKNIKLEKKIGVVENKLVRELTQKEIENTKSVTELEALLKSTKTIMTQELAQKEQEIRASKERETNILKENLALQEEVFKNKAKYNQANELLLNFKKTHKKEIEHSKAKTNNFKGMVFQLLRKVV